MSGKPFVKLTPSTPSHLKLRAVALPGHAAPFHLHSCLLLCVKIISGDDVDRALR